MPFYYQKCSKSNGRCESAYISIVKSKCCGIQPSSLSTRIRFIPFVESEVYHQRRVRHIIVPALQQSLLLLLPKKKMTMMIKLYCFCFLLKGTTIIRLELHESPSENRTILYLLLTQSTTSDSTLYSSDKFITDITFIMTMRNGSMESFLMTYCGLYFIATHNNASYASIDCCFVFFDRLFPTMLLIDTMEWNVLMSITPGGTHKLFSIDSSRDIQVLLVSLR